MELYRSDYVVNGRTGFLIQSDAELSARLDQLGRRCRLAPLLCQGCNSARRQFDWDKIAGQWAAVFETGLAETPALRSTKSILNICPRAVAQP